MSHYITHISDQDFDRYAEMSEKQIRDATISSDDAFVAAMNAAIRRGRVKVKPGTVVDTRPCTTRRMRGDVAAGSGCGSPAAMCAAEGTGS